MLRDAGDIQVASQAEKMSKSRGNVVNPDHIVEEYGADALRLYEMFMGPLEASLPWSMTGVNGVRNFLDRTWRMIVDQNSETLTPNPAVNDSDPSPEQNKFLHRTIQAVSHDVANIEFNTAIARMMEFVNFFTKQSTRPQVAMEKLVLMLAPLAPHICEELWRVLGHDETLAYEPWPEFEESLTKDDTVEIPVQIMGKVRSRIEVAAAANKDQIEASARDDERIQELLSGHEIVKVVVVPGRMINFVVKK